MTKIKNFKISLRAREMARWLKKERGVETTPELEFSLEQVSKEAKRWIEPAAVYSTLTRQVAEKTTTIVFPEKSIAVTVLAVSVGPALERERQTIPSDSPRQPLLAALLQEALAQTLQFAVRLVQDQAKQEDCDMTAPETTQDVQMAGSLATLVGVQRIGIELGTVPSDFPAHARLAWTFWTPVGKGAARRPEKAVA